MSLTLGLEQITPAAQAQVGGKAAALAELARLGYAVPPSLVITTAAYGAYLQQTGLGGRILMELGRKDFREMRWEELWDGALRIRNLFLKTPLPPELAAGLTAALQRCFGDQALALRSSAPGEDSAQCSFAGLHDSYLQVCGRRRQLLALRKVWASLWSDRALLYRQELELNIDSSAMAVLVQTVVAGEKSGVVFSRSPNYPDCLAIEAVAGLNQGLVDGSIEPDSWLLDRASRSLIEHRPALREQKLVAAAGGVELQALSVEEKTRPLLTPVELSTLAATALALEQQRGQPQDLEWTWQGEQLVLLQARPLTTGGSAAEDPRLWYLGLHRSLDNLKQLQQRIEQQILPGMAADAARLAEVDLRALTDTALAAEIEGRRQIQQHWEGAYRSDCIPMAHGIRLFGEFYNDSLQPEDPFEFVELLRGGDFRALERNRRLAELARGGQPPAKGELQALAESLGLSPELTLKLLQQLAARPAPPHRRANRRLEQAFRQHFPAAERDRAEELLAVGRASYRLRDDDNLSLDQVNRELQRAVAETERRLETRDCPGLRQLLAQTAPTGSALHSPTLAPAPAAGGVFRARQLQGQPASPGLATGLARVIRAPADLAGFQAGEILVCDAIDPAMTFIVPLAAGIIERRGGMLIHGAIIAREYAIPCVSGIAGAADIIRSGDRITLDGYLGLVFFPPASGQLFQPAEPHRLRKELDDSDRG